MKTHEVKIFRKNRECETIRGLTSTQTVALDEVFRHHGVTYKKFIYDGNHLESVDWIEMPDLLAALEALAADERKFVTVYREAADSYVAVCNFCGASHDDEYQIEHKSDCAIVQARAALAGARDGEDER